MEHYLIRATIIPEIVKLIEKEYGLDINSIVSYIKEKNEQTRYSKIL